MSRFNRGVMGGTILIVAAAVSFIPGCLDRQNARELCQLMCAEILIEAKANSPEYGTYEAHLEERDPWDNQLNSALVIAELSNIVVVSSSGKDGAFGTDDDIKSHRSDIHVRKTIAKGIQSGAHSAGKGLTTGIIEGLGEASDAALAKAKTGLSKTRSKLMSRFKKKKEIENAGN